MLYGVRRTVRFKSVDAQWYRACGVRLLRVVIVKVDDGAIGTRVFFCTDASVDVPAILETYAGRWAIEVCFRDLKQLLGFGDSSARKRTAVERTAPFVGFVYTTLVLWFAEGAHCSRIALPPVRPWYRHKRGLCFADVLRATQRALTPLDVLDPRRSIANLRKPHRPHAGRGLPRLRRAA
jgi:Transposase DDE domain